MSHYKSNLRDIEFNLFELFGLQDKLGTGVFEEMDVDTVKSILGEVERLATNELAASFVEADRNPPVFDPKTFTAPVSDAFKKSYDAWMDSGFWALGIPEEIGGQAAPASLLWTCAEMVLGANAPVWFFSNGPFMASVVYKNGTDRDKRIAQIMTEKQWGATMVLTEPDAGSDVGAGRSKATLNEDGTWNVTGVKRFITGAEAQLQDNIVHLVLARPEGVEGAGGPGTKGLSLFLVPKFHFDLETGELGARNGAYTTGLEHKMGIKHSNTCEVTFGDPQIGGGEPAIGYLLGEVHNGIAQMFDVIEGARMLVGTKAMSTLSTGYLNALEYAKGRVQGPDLTQAADKTAPKVTITHHPDVRRSLLTQKSYAEGLRSLVTYTSSWQDALMLKRAAGEDAKFEESLNDLLLPLVKGYGSERAWVLLGTESLQTLGGSGFLQDYPIEQYVRDAKIDTLYEGTTAIQGLDLFFRKIVKDNGQALGYLANEVQQFAQSDAGNGRLKVEREYLAKGLEDAQAILGAVFKDLLSANPADENGKIENMYKVGLNTTRLVYVLGDIVVGWLLLRGAEVAINALDAGATGSDKDFYEGKVAAASFFARNVLPKLAGERIIAESIDDSVMTVPEAAF